METIEKLFSKEEKLTNLSKIVFFGETGSGKTTLLLEYINYYAKSDNFPYHAKTVKLFDARNIEDLDYQYREFAKELGIETEDLSDEVLRKKVFETLSKRPHWLLCFDNASLKDLISNRNEKDHSKIPYIPEEKYKGHSQFGRVIIVQSPKLDLKAKDLPDDNMRYITVSRSRQQTDGSMVKIPGTIKRRLVEHNLKNINRKLKEKYDVASKIIANPIINKSLTLLNLVSAGFTLAIDKKLSKVVSLDGYILLINKSLDEDVEKFTSKIAGALRYDEKENLMISQSRSEIVKYLVSLLKGYRKKEYKALKYICLNAETNKFTIEEMVDLKYKKDKNGSFALCNFSQDDIKSLKRIKRSDWEKMKDYDEKLFNKIQNIIESDTAYKKLFFYEKEREFIENLLKKYGLEKLSKKLKLAKEYRDERRSFWCCLSNLIDFGYIQKNPAGEGFSVSPIIIDGIYQQEISSTSDETLDEKKFNLALKSAKNMLGLSDADDSDTELTYSDRLTIDNTSLSSKKNNARLVKHAKSLIEKLKLGSSESKLSPESVMLSICINASRYAQGVDLEKIISSYEEIIGRFKVNLASSEISITNILSSDRSDKKLAEKIFNYLLREDKALPIVLSKLLYQYGRLVFWLFDDDFAFHEKEEKQHKLKKRFHRALEIAQELRELIDSKKNKDLVLKNKDALYANAKKDEDVIETHIMKRNGILEYKYKYLNELAGLKEEEVIDAYYQKEYAKGELWESCLNREYEGKRSIIIKLYEKTIGEYLSLFDKVRSCALEELSEEELSKLKEIDKSSWSKEEEDQIKLYEKVNYGDLSEKLVARYRNMSKKLYERIKKLDVGEKDKEKFSLNEALLLEKLMNSVKDISLKPIISYDSKFVKSCNSEMARAMMKISRIKLIGEDDKVTEDYFDTVASLLNFKLDEENKEYSLPDNEARKIKYRNDLANFYIHFAGIESGLSHSERQSNLSRAKNILIENIRGTSLSTVGSEKYVYQSHILILECLLLSKEKNIDISSEPEISLPELRSRADSLRERVKLPANSSLVKRYDSLFSKLRSISSDKFLFISQLRAGFIECPVFRFSIFAEKHPLDDSRLKLEKHSCPKADKGKSAVELDAASAELSPSPDTASGARAAPGS